MKHNPTHPLDSAHCFIVYFHEQLFYLFNTLERKKNTSAHRLHKGKLFTRLLGEEKEKEGKILIFPIYEFHDQKCTILKNLWNVCPKTLIRLLTGVQHTDTKTLPQWEPGSPRTSVFEIKPYFVRTVFQSFPDKGWTVSRGPTLR